MPVAAAFDPQRTLEKILKGQGPQYLALVQRRIEEPRSQSIPMAEGLCALEILKLARNYPKMLVTENIRKQAKSFLRELNEGLSLRKSRKALIRALMQAVELIPEDSIDPQLPVKDPILRRHLSVEGQIILAIIHLREEDHERPRNTEGWHVTLRKMVTPYHRVRGKPAPISERHWKRCLADPDVVQLLSLP
jgi:hypothetical protein